LAISLSYITHAVARTRTGHDGDDVVHAQRSGGDDQHAFEPELAEQHVVQGALHTATEKFSES
jgi:hypothetical protein